MDFGADANELYDIVRSLKERYGAIKETPGVVSNLLQDFQAIASDLQDIAHLDQETLDEFPEHNRRILQNKLGHLKTFTGDAVKQLRNEIERLHNPLHAGTHTMPNETKVLELAEQATSARQSILSINNTVSTMVRVAAMAGAVQRMESLDTNGRRRAAEPFHPINNAPRNGALVVIDFPAVGSAKKLKEALLRTGTGASIEVIAQGPSGVGKSCTLQAVANDSDVVERFPGGVYFMRLGKDGTIPLLIQQLCDAVKDSGGSLLADKLRQERDLDVVISEVRNWFGEHVCLFIFDDVWQSNDIGEDLLQGLSRLIGNIKEDGEGSRLLYSTRDKQLVERGEAATFDPTDAEGPEALQILLRVAGADNSELNDPDCRAAIKTILQHCDGYPIALKVCGCTIRQFRRKLGENARKAWEEYLTLLQRLDVVMPSPDDSMPLAQSLLLSLEYLDGRYAFDEIKGVRLTYREMHRALCVLQKQDWVPQSFLRHAWGLKDEHTAKVVVDAMDKFGVADAEYRLVNGDVYLGLRLHDLVHDFAKDEALQREEESKWCMQVLKGYELESMSTDRDTCWPADVADDGYFLQNLSRLMYRAGRGADIFKLLSSPPWIAKMLEMNAISQFETDKNIYLTWSSRGCESISEQNGTRSTRIVQNQEVVLKQLSIIARMSLPYCIGNAAGACFQVYGRLSGTTPRCEWVDQMMLKMAKQAPRLWLKTLTPCLKGANNPLLELFSVPYNEVFDVTFRERQGVMSCGWDSGTGTADAFVGKHSSSGEGKFVRLRSKDLCSYSEREGRVLVLRQRKILSKASHLLGLQNAIKEVFRRCFSASNDDGSNSMATRTESSEETRPTCGAISKDGSRVVMGFKDGSIRIWSSETGEQECGTLKGHGSTVLSIAINASGMRIVSGSEDCTVRIWNVETGDQLGRPLLGHRGSVHSVSISADGTRLLSGSSDRTVRIWDATNGQQLGESLRGHTDWIRCVSMSEDGTRAASGARDGTARIWDLQTGEQVGQPLSTGTSFVDTVAISTDGKHLVTGSADSTISIRNPETGEQIGKPLTGHRALVQSISVSADGRRAVSGSRDHTVRVWDTERGNQHVQPLSGHKDVVQCVDMSANGSRAVSGSLDGTVQIWNAQTGDTVGEALTGHTSWVLSVSINANGTHAVSGSEDGTIRIWDTQFGRQIGVPLTGHTGGVWDVSVSADGTAVVSGSADRTVRVWDVQNGKQVGQPLSGHTDVVQTVSMSANARLAVSGSADGTVRIWNTRTGKLIAGPLSGHTSSVRRVTMSRDGKHVLSRSVDGGARVWDVCSGTCLHVDGDEFYSRYLDDQHLDTVSADAKAQANFESRGADLVYCPDEKVLATFDADIRVFAADADGTSLVVGLYDGTVAILKVIESSD